jgi:hypothetical protein
VSFVKKVAIERKENLAPADFVRDHLQGSGKPVIVKDAIEHWPARSKWTFEHLKASYGSDFVSTSLGLLSEFGKTTKLAAYLDYLDAPDEELAGFWITTKGSKPLRDAPATVKSLHYLLDWNAFQRHPELLEDIRPVPYFIADWESTLSPTMREVFEWSSSREYSSVYIGPAGTFSPLHQDFGDTHTYLAQIQGRKQAILFSPDDGEFLYEGKVDPERPDLQRFALFDRATAYECVIEPGELLFMPPNWWHCVRALDKSITVSHNFFNDVNFNQHLANIIRQLPKLVEGLAKSPEWRAELGVKWNQSGLETPEG